MMLSSNAQNLFNFMVNEYIENGFMYSGSIGGYGFHHAGLKDWVDMKQAVDELQQLGLIEIRKCAAFAVELSKKIRKELIIKHNLHKKWEIKGSSFYPNSENGEIGKVLTPFERIRMEY